MLKILYCPNCGSYVKTVHVEKTLNHFKCKCKACNFRLNIEWNLENATDEWFKEYNFFPESIAVEKI